MKRALSLTTSFSSCSSLILLGLLCSTSVESQKFSFGRCPAVVSSTPITLSQLTAGTWSVYARTPSPREHVLKCINFSFAQIVANVRYNFIYSALNKKTGASVRRTGTLEVVNGVAAATTLAIRGYLGFLFDDKRIAKSMRYSVIYASSVTVAFMLLYACEDKPFGKIESALLLSSVPLTTTQIASVVNRLPGIGSSEKLVMTTVDEDCF